MMEKGQMIVYVDAKLWTWNQHSLNSDFACNVAGTTRK
jgi:hypothetical protein